LAALIRKIAFENYYYAPPFPGASCESLNIRVIHMDVFNFSTYFVSPEDWSMKYIENKVRELGQAAARSHVSYISRHSYI
jgi:hypothetical protein